MGLPYLSVVDLVAEKISAEINNYRIHPGVGGAVK